MDPIRNELELASDQSSVEILVCPNCLGAAQRQENAGELVQNYEYGSWKEKTIRYVPLLLSRRLPVQGDSKWLKDKFVRIIRACILLPKVSLKADSTAKFLQSNRSLKIVRGRHASSEHIHTACSPMNLSGERLKLVE